MNPNIANPFNRIPGICSRFVALMFCMLIVSGLFGCSTATSPVETEPGKLKSEPPKPNIVLILADDLGWGDVGYHGGDIKTPAIDRLAREGVQLNRLYTYPACTQTRAALMSGKRMRSVGLLEPMPPWTDAGLPLQIETLATYLQAQDYATWKVGKWHLGDHYVEQFPNQRGFDHFYGFLGGEVNYYTHVMASALDWQRNGQTVSEEGYSTHLLTDEAVRLLEEHPSDKPFFLDISYNAPHTPLQAPDDALEKYAHIEDKNRRRYAAMVSEMDDGIASVIEAIKARDDADRTVVIFMSDNGGSKKFGADNGLLRGGKTTHYEGGIRVPGLVWWPATLSPNKVDEFISVHDLFPTLLSLAGVSSGLPGDLDGHNVWSAIVDNTNYERQKPIVFALMIPGRPGTPATYSASVIDDGWKLIETSIFNRKAQTVDNQYTISNRELFNILADPEESKNLIEENPDKAAELAAALQAVPMGNPIGFVPPPPDWKLGLVPGAEPDNNAPTRTPVVEAAIERAQKKAGK